MPFIAKDLAVTLYAQCTCGCTCTRTEVCTCGGGCTAPTSPSVSDCVAAPGGLNALRDQLRQTLSLGR